MYSFPISACEVAINACVRASVKRHVDCSGRDVDPTVVVMRREVDVL